MSGYFNSKEFIGALGTSISFSEIEAATIITEAEGIGSNDNDTTIPTSAAVKDYADSAGTTIFTGLTDTPGSYTTGNAIYTTNGTPDAVIETTVVLTEGANTFNLTKGTASLDIAAGSVLNVDANLTVEATSIINQDLSSDAAPTFATLNLTGNSNQIVLDSDDGSGFTTTLTDSATAARVLTFPDATDTLVGRDTTDTLTNKTINTASNTITVLEADISDLQSYLLNVVEDTTPQLGGDLDTNSNDITNSGEDFIDLDSHAIRINSGLVLNQDVGIIIAGNNAGDTEAWKLRYDVSSGDFIAEVDTASADITDIDSTGYTAIMTLNPTFKYINAGSGTSGIRMDANANRFHATAVPSQGSAGYDAAGNTFFPSFEADFTMNSTGASRIYTGFVDKAESQQGSPGAGTGVGSFSSSPGYTSTGTLASLFGLKYYPRVTNASGTVTNSHGVFIDNALATGTLTNQYGIYINDLTSGTNDYGIYIAGADTAAIAIAADNDVISFGTGLDADIYYDGTHLVIDPRVVGTGNVNPGGDDGGALGTSGTAWSDLFLASGGVINFNAGDVTVTHSANTLAFAGASSGYTFDTGFIITETADHPGTPAAGSGTLWVRNDTPNVLVFTDDAGTDTVVGGVDVSANYNWTGAHTWNQSILPNTDDGAALGASGQAWSDLFLASGAVINSGAGEVTLTFAANALTIAGEDILAVDSRSLIINNSVVSSDNQDVGMIIPGGDGTNVQAFRIRHDVSADELVLEFDGAAADLTDIDAAGYTTVLRFTGTNGNHYFNNAATQGTQQGSFFCNNTPVTGSSGLTSFGGDAYANFQSNFSHNSIAANEIYAGFRFTADFTDTTPGAGSGIAAFHSSPLNDTASVTLPKFIGLYHYPRINNASAVVTDSYGVYIDDANVAAGTLTNQYGIFVADMTAGGTNNYAIKTGTGIVEFDGSKALTQNEDSLLYIQVFS